MTDPSKSRERGGRRRRRLLSPVQKYEAFVQVLTGEMTVAECADHWGVDRSTIMRAREVATLGKQAAQLRRLARNHGHHAVASPESVSGLRGQQPRSVPAALGHTGIAALIASGTDHLGGLGLDQLLEHPPGYLNPHHSVGHCPLCAHCVLCYGLATPAWRGNPAQGPDIGIAIA